MTLCEMFARYRFDNDAVNMVWLSLHLFGIFVNYYGISALKLNWKRLGNVKILLATNIFSNIASLLLHLHKPVNALVHSSSGIQWNFGEFLCTFLPSITNLTMAASTVSFTGIILEQYYKRIYHSELSLKNLENVVVLIWAWAGIISAPQFCECGSHEFLREAQMCLPPWYTDRKGLVYESVRLILQYAFPIAVAASAFFKDQIVQLTSDGYSQVAQCACISVNTCAAIFLAAVIYTYPVPLLRPFATNHALVDISGAMSCMEFLTVVCCIVVPFEVVAIIGEEVSGGKLHSRIRGDEDDDDLLDLNTFRANGKVHFGTTDDVDEKRLVTCA
ncbi:predicted protein [Nematostella vectensis]|uniref:G-protein coupled receptors family 1 profile domain-containing protein n=1 Tax=Nematostella vectensis TaxID=45351 RepID=A7SU75_NEMVE|nr:uncharacterized protein LOC5503896 [Nematostella vectensis]EDO32753.1 predicted protein [Nematostella vectensis]|eukprot:XP_001624853.1 predicted protein [Nematostella vectensis]